MAAIARNNNSLSIDYQVNDEDQERSASFPANVSFVIISQHSGAWDSIAESGFIESMMPGVMLRRARSGRVGY